MDLSCEDASWHMGRRHVGVELKRSYFEQAARNLEDMDKRHEQATLLDGLGD